MRSRGAVVWIGLLVVVVLVGGGSAYLLVGRHRSKTPEQVAQAYFAAWRNGGLDTMGTLVADPPADFAEQHRALSRGLGVTAIRLDPSPVVRQGTDAARADFTVTRTLSQGDWTFKSTLVLVRRHGDWKVGWSPATLYPGLKGDETWKLGQIQAPGATAVDRAGKPLPGGSTAQGYLPELVDDYGGEEDSTTAWAIELLVPGQSKPKQVKVFGKVAQRRLRTTLDARTQAAADSAVHSIGKPAAIVAVRPSTGEVLAVADTLDGRGAFVGLYPPGSTFKVVTAAALVSSGMGPSSAASCPDSVVTAQRTIRNHDGVKLGSTTLGQAFAQSCNTTFAQLTTDRLGAGKLAAQAKLFGFGSSISPGVQAYEGDFPGPRNGAELAEAAIGQGRVQASPLSMALVAAAVADGEWRPPRLVSARLLPKGGSPPHPIPRALLAALRPMMRSVVTSGTAAAAGMPAGVAGKTGTAEYDNAGHSHAWFIGYKGDFAFAVFVQGGESGPAVAAPLAARFLKAR